MNLRLSPLWWAGLAGLALLGGCGRASTLSQVDSEGGLERKVTLTLTAMGPGESPDPSKLISFQGQPAWTIARRTQDQESILEATRKLAPGESESGSFTVTDGGSGKARCQVKAVKRPNGLIEYTETWMWEGDKSSASDFLKAASDEEFKKPLAALGATDAQVVEIGRLVGRDLRKVILGPGDPILGLIITDPQLGLRKVRAAMSRSVDKAILEILPDVSAESRSKAVKEIVTASANSLNEKRAETTSSDTPPNSSGILLSFEIGVEGPGQVVESNGEVDPVDGRVYWSMYLEAAEGENVVLRAIFKP